MRHIGLCCIKYGFGYASVAVRIISCLSAARALPVASLRSRRPCNVWGGALLRRHLHLSSLPPASSHRVQAITQHGAEYSGPSYRVSCQVGGRYERVQGTCPRLFVVPCSRENIESGVLALGRDPGDACESSGSPLGFRTRFCRQQNKLLVWNRRRASFESERPTE